MSSKSSAAVFSSSLSVSSRLIAPLGFAAELKKALLNGEGGRAGDPADLRTTC